MAINISTPPSQVSMAQNRILNLLWRENSSILEMLKEVSKNLSNITSISKEKYQEDLNSILQTKSEAERIRKDFLEYISKAALTLMYRDEWIRVASKMTSIIDKIVGIAYRLEQLLNHNLRIDSSLEEYFSAFGEKITSIISDLGMVFNLIGVDIERALKICEKIEAREKEIDSLYREINFKILSSKISIRELLLLKEIAEMMEDIADTVDHATDDLRIILLSMK